MPRSEDQGASVEPDQDVFRAPVDGAHGLVADGRFEAGGDGPAQAPIAYDEVEHAPLRQGGRDTASRRFYFRELGRVRLGRRALLDLRFFVRDVLAHDRIEFLRFQFVGVQALVLGGRVVMPGARRRDQFDFVAHELLLKP